MVRLRGVWIADGDGALQVLLGRRRHVCLRDRVDLT